MQSAAPAFDARQAFHLMLDEFMTLENASYAKTYSVRTFHFSEIINHASNLVSLYGHFKRVFFNHRLYPPAPWLELFINKLFGLKEFSLGFKLYEFAVSKDLCTLSLQNKVLETANKTLHLEIAYRTANRAFPQAFYDEKTLALHIETLEHMGLYEQAIEFANIFKIKPKLTRLSPYHFELTLQYASAESIEHFLKIFALELQHPQHMIWLYIRPGVLPNSTLVHAREKVQHILQNVSAQLPKNLFLSAENTTAGDVLTVKILPKLYLQLDDLIEKRRLDEAYQLYQKHLEEILAPKKLLIHSPVYGFIHHYHFDLSSQSFGVAYLTLKKSLNFIASQKSNRLQGAIISVQCESANPASHASSPSLIALEEIQHNDDDLKFVTTSHPIKPGYSRLVLKPKRAKLEPEGNFFKRLQALRTLARELPHEEQVKVVYAAARLFTPTAVSVEKRVMPPVVASVIRQLEL